MIDVRMKEREQIINEFLLCSNDLGWNIRALDQSIENIGLSEGVRHRAFPGGMPEVTDYFLNFLDEQMILSLKTAKIENLRVRDKVHFCIKTRIQIADKYRESIKRLFSYLMLPPNAPLALRFSWRTASKVWYLAGDQSTDWNYYTKRGLLASVYSLTIMFWLSDTPDDTGDYPATWNFLERRINNVIDTFSLPKKFMSFARNRICSSGKSIEK